MQFFTNVGSRTNQSQMKMHPSLVRMQFNLEYSQVSIRAKMYLAASVVNEKGLCYSISIIKSYFPITITTEKEIEYTRYQ